MQRITVSTREADSPNGSMTVALHVLASAVLTESQEERLRELDHDLWSLVGEVASEDETVRRELHRVQPESTTEGRV